MNSREHWKKLTANTKPRSNRRDGLIITITGPRQTAGQLRGGPMFGRTRGPADGDPVVGAADRRGGHLLAEDREWIS